MESDIEAQYKMLRDEYKKVSSQFNAIKRKYWKEKGWCRICGRQELEDVEHRLCAKCVKLAQKHRNNERIRMNEKYRERVESGLCVACGKPKGEACTVFCTECADKKNAYQRKLRNSKK